jgi:hypothetical protein
MEGPGAPGDAAGLCALELAARRAAHASAESLSRRAIAAQLGRSAASLQPSTARRAAARASRHSTLALRAGMCHPQAQLFAPTLVLDDSHTTLRTLEGCFRFATRMEQELSLTAMQYVYRCTQLQRLESKHQQALAAAQRPMSKAKAMQLHLERSTLADECRQVAEAK